MNKILASLVAISAALTIQGCAVAAGVRTGTHQQGRMRVAVLPVENLSGSAAPLSTIRSEIVATLLKTGFSVCDDQALSKFIAEHRMRFTGGIDNEVAQAMKNELKVDAALITSLELYTEDASPKVGILSRLVVAGENAEIMWMESVAITGFDDPGVLGLGLVTSPEKLRSKAMTRLSDSLRRFLAGEVAKGGVPGRFAPKVAFDAVPQVEERKPVIVVLPFVNQSMRRNAGEIQVLHFVKQLVDTGLFRVTEPGVVRNRMLNMRIIMEDGVSLPQVDLISMNMKADLVLTGKVFEYQDSVVGTGNPKVDFSVQLLDGAGKKVIWASKSYNEGDDGVYFYDLGRTYTAGALAEKMTQAVLREMFDKENNKQGIRVQNRKEESGAL